MRLDSSLIEVKGIGEKTASIYSKIGIRTIKDLIFYFPRDYEQFEPCVLISECTEQKKCAVFGVVQSTPIIKKIRNLTILSLMIKDESGQIKITFFNMPYLKNVFQIGARFVFCGVVTKSSTGYQMEHPTIHKLEDYQALLSKLQPVYSLCKGLSNRNIVKTIGQVRECMMQIEETLPEYLLQEFDLWPYAKAIEEIHMPRDFEHLIAARKRIAFQEFFQFLFQIRKLKERTQIIKNGFPMIDVSETKHVIESLPFRLTEDQYKVWEEVKQDLQGEYAMNRLIQGDVGSGKTILAFLSLLMTAVNGYQGAMMAPTEVLAKQHFESLTSLIQSYKLPLVPVLLTGSTPAKDRKIILEQIKQGTANVIIGTHALFQEKVDYKNLALVITDEQHRFGVRQREELSKKGDGVHVLVMSATPIPRTLAILLYGDMHLSVIHQVPANRLPIKNCVVNTGYRATAYKFMEKEVMQGRQVYVICPMVEQTENSDLEDVETYCEKLQAVLPDSIQIAFLHGKMKPSEKNLIMEAFEQKNIDILVSTTVIEVGINVPNATVMMVENAERFGLSSLHQLRGRVGRGKEQSYCIFVNSSDSKTAQSRLDTLVHSNDGFYIAEEDLKQRGPGDLFGIRQSGIMEFVVADIFKDADLLTQASECVERIMKEDPDLKEKAHSMIRECFPYGDCIQIDFRSI